MHHLFYLALFLLFWGTSLHATHEDEGPLKRIHVPMPESKDHHNELVAIKETALQQHTKPQQQKAFFAALEAVFTAAHQKNPRFGYMTVLNDLRAQLIGGDTNVDFDDLIRGVHLVFAMAQREVAPN